MPVQYSGVVDEHLTVRQACGLFDSSHMGEINIAWPMALDFVQYVMSNDVHKLAPGRAQYTLLCNESGESSMIYWSTATQIVLLWQ